MLSNYFRKRKNTKKGFTLVEAICSVMIMAIVFAGVLNAIAFSKQMVYTENVRDKASDKAQLIADELISVCTGKNPDDPNLTTSVLPAIESDINSIINNNQDPQFASIGQVHLVNTLTDVKVFNPSVNDTIQVTITPVSGTLSDSTVGGIACKDSTQAGWDITLRIYYRAIGGKDSWQATEISAFAPFQTAS